MMENIFLKLFHHLDSLVLCFFFVAFLQIESEQSRVYFWETLSL